MTLAASGLIGIGGSSPRSINLELGRSATATSSLNESALRTLAAKPSGAIAFSDFYNKSAATQVSYISRSVGVLFSNVNYPSGIASGNMLILHVFAHETSAVNPPTITAPTGWTESRNDSIAKATSAIFYKIADGTESGSVSLSVFGEGSETYLGVIYRFSNASSITSLTTASSSASSTSMPANSVTTQNLGIACQFMSCRGVSTITEITGESGGDYTESDVEVTDGTGASGITMSLQIDETATGTTITGGTATLGTSRPDRFIQSFCISP